MGIFDVLSSGNKTELKDEKEAFVAIVFGCMAADGEISNEEVGSMIGVFSTKQMFNGVNVNDIFKKVAKLHNQLGGAEKLIEAAASKITENLKLTTFANAVDLVMADGFAHDKEKSLLSLLQSKLSISDADATKIMEVIVIKNRG
jgi:uncharacterized tellurite resistance protein B-like protein